MLASICLSIACNEADEKDDSAECQDSQPPLISYPEELGETLERLAKLTVDEWTDENQIKNGVISAFFIAVKESDTIPAIGFGQACVGIAGEYEVEPPEMLNVDSVMINGLISGKLNLEKTQSGAFGVEIINGPIFSNETKAVNVQVAADQGGEMVFPGFEHGVDIPEAIELNHIVLNSDRSMGFDWIPTDSSFFEIMISAQGSDPELPDNRLRCILEDDGCHEIPAGAIEWLMSHGIKEVKVRLERHTLGHLAVETGALVELDVIRTLKMYTTLE